MPRIAHVSDTHGYLVAVPTDTDIIVHSGDFMPNKSFGHWAIESAYQPKWIEDASEKIKRWIGDRPFLITHGNHDFINSVPHLISLGIDAHQLDDVRYVHNNITFYGFPHVPAFRGEWNYERSNPELVARTEAIDLEGVNFLVAHAPIYGILDRNSDGERCGSRPMKKFLQHNKYVPDYYLCGHIHEAHGYQDWSRGIKVYNSATIVQVINV